jgi:1-deoxy-D-xylulose-5-phosphate synthase
MMGARLRYPRGESVGVDLPEVGIPLTLAGAALCGKGLGRTFCSARGCRVLKAADELLRGSFDYMADARFAKL